MSLKRFCEGCDKEIGHGEFYCDVTLEVHKSVEPGPGDPLAGAGGDYCIECAVTSAAPGLARWLTDTYSGNAKITDVLGEMTRTMAALDACGRLPPADALRGTVVNASITLRNARQGGLTGDDCLVLAGALEQAVCLKQQRGPKPAEVFGLRSIIDDVVSREPESLGLRHAADIAASVLRNRAELNSELSATSCDQLATALEKALGIAQDAPEAKEATP